VSMERPRRSVLPPSRARRWWVLALALLLVAGAGGVHLWQWLDGLRGHELLEFFTFYLALPLAAGMLLLFAYLKPPGR